MRAGRLDRPSPADGGAPEPGHATMDSGATALAAHRDRRRAERITLAIIFVAAIAAVLILLL